MKQVTAKQFKKRFLMFIKNPFFWMLTVGGNLIILLGAVLLYAFESGVYPSMSFLDCLVWSTGFITTVGYGEYAAATTAGKITIFFLMITGTLFIWTYMAFLVTGLMSPELHELEKDMRDVEKELRDLKGTTPQ
jgi:hypothetical protein